MREKKTEREEEKESKGEKESKEKKALLCFVTLPRFMI